MRYGEVDARLSLSAIRLGHDDPRSTQPRIYQMALAR